MGCSMRYIDIFIKACALSPRDFQLTFSTRPGDKGYDRLNRKVLAWSANHEHAVFDLQDEVHPATVYVWFEWHSKGLWYGGPWNTIYKIKRFKTVLNANNWWYDWGFAERSDGNIPFVNNNPFDPRKENAASNTAASVFPQNISPNIHRQRKKNPPPTPAPEIITKVCYDKDIRRYLVFESSYWDIEQFHLIKVCETEEEADYFVPKFKEGDFVDIPTHGLFNVQVAEIARCVGGDEDIENELSYNIVGVKYASFKASELEKVQNRGIRTQ